MIRSCTKRDLPAIHEIINEAAEAYRGVIPGDCWHEPYMSDEELLREIAAGVLFSGWEEGELAGVMGFQVVRGVGLIRHAYVRPNFQGRGVGAALLAALIDQAPQALLVGTWADARWAIRFYERHGFCVVSDVDEKNRLLDTYWTIPARQRDVSLVLKHVHG